MRTLVALLLAIAALGASEERFVKRFDEAMASLKRAGGADGEAQVVRAAQVLTADGPMGDAGAAAVAAALRQLVATDGAAVRWDRLGEREYGSHAQVFYLLVVFDRGVAFARVVAAKTVDDKTVLVAFTIAADPFAVFPAELLAPDGTSLRR